MPLQRTIVVRLWKISSVLFIRAVKRRERRAPAAQVWQWLFASNIASFRDGIVKIFFASDINQKIHSRKNFYEIHAHLVRTPARFTDGI